MASHRVKGIPAGGLRREGEGDDVVYLRTDDDICLAVAMQGDQLCEVGQRRQFLGAQVFGSRMCELVSSRSATEDLPADLWSCSFRLEQAVSVRALQELMVAGQDGSTGTSRRVLLYGHAIRLRHNASQKYLSCLDSSSSTDKLAFDVGLCESASGENLWWRIQPASKQRSEGEKVRAGDDIILVSISTERYLNTEVAAIQASFQLTFWRVFPVCLGTDRAQAIGHINGGDVVRLFHRHVTQCLTTSKKANTQTDCVPHYEAGAVGQQARSLWRVELMKIRFGGGFLSWGQCFRLCHVISGKYLAVKDGKTQLLALPSSDESRLIMVTNQDMPCTAEDKEFGMGKPQIKFGESVVFIRHAASGMWLAHQVLKGPKRKRRKEGLQPVVLSQEYHVDLSFSVTRATPSELQAADVLHVSLQSMRFFSSQLTHRQNDTPSSRSPSPSATALSSVPEMTNNIDSDLVAVMEAGAEYRGLHRRASNARRHFHRMYSIGAMSLYSGSSSGSSLDDSMEVEMRSSIIGVDPMDVHQKTQMTAEHLKDLVMDLLDFFAWPSAANDYDEFQAQVKRLQHRQNFFQEQGMIMLIIETIEAIGTELNLICRRSPDGVRACLALIETSQSLLKLVAAMVRGNRKNCSAFAHDQCLNWLSDRLRDFYADGVLEILHCLVQTSSEALNAIRGRHIRDLINLLDMKGRNPKLLDVLSSLCACNGIAVRGNQNLIADLLLSQRDLLLQSKRFTHIESVRPGVFVCLNRDSALYHRWYCEVRVRSLPAATILARTGGAVPCHLRVGWANSSGMHCWPGHASNDGIEAVGGTLSSVGFDGRHVWCGGGSCVVPGLGPPENTSPKKPQCRQTLAETQRKCVDTEIVEDQVDPRALSSKALHSTYLNVGDVVGMCLDLHAASVTFSLNGKLLDCHVEGFDTQHGVFFPVVSMDAGIECSFHLGGNFGYLSSMPPNGFASLHEAITVRSNVSVQRCVETGALKNRELVGPPCLSEHAGYTPAPIATGNVSLPDLSEASELLAENIHEVWSMNKIENGWTFGERNDSLRTSPCLRPYSELSDEEKFYDREMAFRTLKTLVALGYGIGLEANRELAGFVDLPADKYLQKNGYIPKPLDLSKVTLPNSLKDLTEILAQNVHDVWAAQRIAEGWTFGLAECSTMKRNPLLVPYDKLPESAKKANRDTVGYAVKTILGFGYKLKEPTRQRGKEDIQSLGRETSSSTEVTYREFRGQLDQAIYSGKWYYEVELKSNGFMRIGWATTKNSVISMLGSDENSFVFDGFLARKWHQGSETFGRTWKTDDVVGCLLDLDKQTISFTLNGLLLKDAVGNKVAFDHIQKEDGFVPAVCLGPAQAVTVHLGRDLGEFKMFNHHGLQEGYEPLCSMFNHFMPVWASSDVPCFIDIPCFRGGTVPVSAHDRLVSAVLPPLSDRPPRLRLSSKAVRGMETPQMECVRLNLGIPCDGSPLKAGPRFSFAIRLSPGQDRSTTWLGWVASSFSPQSHSLEEQIGMSVSVCRGAWRSEETESTESMHEDDVNFADGEIGQENQLLKEHRSLHVKCVSHLVPPAVLERAASSSLTDGLVITCVLNVDEKTISYRFNGHELQKFTMQVPADKLLFPAFLVIPTGQDVLDIEFGCEEDCSPIFDGVLRCIGRTFIVPPTRIKLQRLEQAEWRLLPTELLSLVTSQGPGGELNVAVKKPRSSVTVEVPGEGFSCNLSELVERPALMDFHAKTLALYSALCMHGNQTVADIISQQHVDQQQLMDCIRMKDLPGCLNCGFFELLSTLHLDRHVNARLLTRGEFVIPLALVKKTPPLAYCRGSMHGIGRFQTQVSLASAVLSIHQPTIGHAVNAAQPLASKGVKNLCSTLTRASKQGCSVKSTSAEVSGEFAFLELKAHVLDNLEEALRQHSRDNYRLTEQRQKDILVPLLKICDELLVMGMFGDTDVQQVLLLIDPKTFSESGGVATMAGLVSLPLHEDVKVQVCYLLQHLSDLQLRHRIEAIVAFADNFVGAAQQDQEKRLEEIKEATSMSAALTAKKTREFRMSPLEQMRALLSFKYNLGSPDCPLKKPLQIELELFHRTMLKHCCANDTNGMSPGGGQDNTSYLDRMRMFIKSMVDRLHSSFAKDAVTSSPSEEPDSNALQKLIKQTVLSWGRQEIHSQELVWQVFDLLYRQYNGLGEVCAALGKAYVVEGDGAGKIQDLLEALGNVRSLLRVKMASQEEGLLHAALDELRNNTMIFQHPDLMRLLGVHETVLSVMRNVLGEEDDTTVSSSGVVKAQPQRKSSYGQFESRCKSPQTVAACCRFLSYFCRASRQNQRAMFDHLGYLLMHSGTGLVDPAMRGATPLDVATAIMRCNQELALALKERHLERIVALLASTVTGLSVAEILGQQRQDDFNGLTSQDSFSRDDWQPNDGERYLNFLRQAVFINGQTVEENAVLVVRLLIRRPECLGPGLDGEGTGLLECFRDALFYINTLYAGRQLIDGSTERFVHKLKPKDPEYSAKKEVESDACKEREDGEESFAHRGRAVLNYYSNLLDLLGRCTPSVDFHEEQKASEVNQKQTTPGMRRRGILQSLVALSDLQGILAIPFEPVEPPSETCSVGPEVKEPEVKEPDVKEPEVKEPEVKEPQFEGIEPQHKASVIVFLQRVYSISTQDMLFELLNKSVLPDLRLAATLGSSKWQSTQCALEINRFICTSVVPLFTRHVRLFRNADQHAVSLDTLLHTLYALSRCGSLALQQRETISDFLCQLIKQLRPSILQRLLRKMVNDIPKLKETSDVALTLLHVHYDHCARYYGLTSGWGLFGAASNEEKDLTMTLFRTLLEALVVKGRTLGPHLFSKALQCLCSICAAMAPDYTQPLPESAVGGRTPLLGGSPAPTSFAAKQQPDIYVPQPVNTSRIHLPRDLEGYVELLAEHCHDSWASRKLEGGWRHGETKDRERHLHPLLRPFKELSVENQDRSRYPCRQDVCAMIAWGWTIERAKDVELSMIQRRGRKRLKNTMGVSFHPQPFDLDNIPLSKELESMAERLAENRYDVQALTRLRHRGREGRKGTRQLVAYDMLPDKEKAIHRDNARETLQFLLLCGYRLNRNVQPNCGSSFSRQSSIGSTIERRYAYFLLSNVIRREDLILKSLQCYESQHLGVPAAQQNVPSRSQDLLTSFAEITIPLTTEYFATHHEYFLTDSRERKRYGVCSAKEKELVGVIFFKLTKILQQQDSIFGDKTTAAVDCLQQVIKAFDMSLIQCCPKTLRSSLADFLWQSEQDLRMSLSSLARDGYVFTVLLPILISFFSHMGEHHFGKNILHGVSLSTTEKMVAYLYRLGTVPGNIDGSLRPIVGECLSAIASAMPTAFLEGEDQSDADGENMYLHLMDSSQMPLLDHLLAEMELAADDASHNDVSTTGVDGKVTSEQSAVELIADSADFMPAAMTVIAPMLSSYLANWWDQGKDGLCVWGSYKFPTEVTTKMVDTVVSHALTVIGSRFGKGNLVAGWICKTCVDLTPLMRFSSFELLESTFLPLAEKLSKATQKIYNTERHLQQQRSTTEQEAQNIRDYANLARDVHGFFPLVSAYITAHKDTWHRGLVPVEVTSLFLYLADVLHCWYLSMSFRREFQICSATMENRFSLIPTLTSSPAASPVSPGCPTSATGRRNSISSLTAVLKMLGKSGGHPGMSPISPKVSAVQPFKVTLPTRHPVQASSNCIAACLKQLVPLVMAKLGSTDQFLIQTGQTMMLQGLKDHEVANHITSVMQAADGAAKHHKPPTRTSSLVMLHKRVHSVVAGLSCGTAEQTAEQRLQSIMDIVRVVHRLNDVENPQSNKHLHRWRRVLSRQKKQAVVKCFLMVPIHRLARNRAINHFLQVYREEWLLTESLDRDGLMKDIKEEPSVGKASTKPSMSLPGVLPSPNSPSAKSPNMLPTLLNLALPSTLSTLKPVDSRRHMTSSVCPLRQLIRVFSRKASCYSMNFFRTNDSLFIQFCEIMTKSCKCANMIGDEEEEDDRPTTTSELVEAEERKDILKEQQDYLTSRGAAEMVILVLMGSNGRPSLAVEHTLQLGIALLHGGNSNVQERMLKFLKESVDAEFFNSIAALIAQCSVLDMDTYERRNKVEDLGIGGSGLAGDRALHDAKRTYALFRFLQLLCEGHNANFQHYLRTQAGNTTTVNIVICTVDYLLRLQESMSDFFWHYVGRDSIDAQGRENLSRAIHVAKQVFRTLTEYTQGPCKGNQLALAHSRLWDSVGGFLHIFAKLQLKLSQDPAQLELLRELLKLECEMSITLLAMLEETSPWIADQMVSTLVESTEHVADIFKFFDMFLKLNDLATSEAFKEYDTNQDGWISSKEFERAMLAQNMYSREEIAYLMKCADTNNDGFLDYMEFIERFHGHAEDIGFSFAVLMTNLKDHLPGDQRLAHFLKVGKSFLSHFEPQLGRVEIIGRHQKVERVYFLIRKSSIQEWRSPQIQESKREFLRSVDRCNHREKISQFVSFCEDTIFEMMLGSAINNLEHRDLLEKAERHRRRYHQHLKARRSLFPSVNPLKLSMQVSRHVMNASRFCMHQMMDAAKAASCWRTERSRSLRKKYHSQFSRHSTPVKTGEDETDSPAHPLLRTRRSSTKDIIAFTGSTITEERLSPSPPPLVEPSVPNIESKPALLTRSASLPGSTQRSSISERRRLFSRNKAADEVDLAPPSEGMRRRKTGVVSPVYEDSDGEDIFSPIQQSQNQVPPTPPAESRLRRVQLDKRLTASLPRGSFQRMTKPIETVFGAAKQQFKRSVGFYGEERKSETVTPQSSFCYGGSCATSPSKESQANSQPKPKRSPAKEAADLVDAIQQDESIENERHSEDSLGYGSAVYEPHIAIMKRQLPAMFARAFYLSKDTALVLAFIINFLLLFFQVHVTDNKGELVTVVEHFAFFEPVITTLGIIHAILSLAALLGYILTKVLVVLFQREKNIAHRLEFQGMWITDQPTGWFSKDAWDKLAVGSRSFPQVYWNKDMKKEVFTKYAPQYGESVVAGILNLSLDDKQPRGQGIDFRYELWRIGVVLTDKQFLYNLLYLVFSILGNTVNTFFFSAHLLDLVWSIATLRTVLRSVTHNGRRLLLTFLMTSVIVYIYTVFAFNFFRKFYEKEVNGSRDLKCHNMLTCFTFHMYAGLRSGGGIGDNIKDPDGDEYELQRMVFDITFFFFVIVILLAIIQGLIIDSFGELRDHEEDVKLDMETKCFICGIGKERFDKMPHGFEIHVEREHHMAHYLFLFMHLFTKKETDYTGQESYIYNLLVNYQYDFFPIGDAFRLHEAEGASAAVETGNSS